MSKDTPRTTGPGQLLTNDPDGTRKATLILAHGAGAGMDHPFMERMATSLCRRGVRVVRFEFPYMQRRRQTGTGGPPNRPPILMACWKEVIERVGGPRLFIGGKSMGGRIASMIADEVEIEGLVCLGYPFHPPGRPDRLRTEHLENLRTRCLIVQGERDPFGNRDETAGYALSPNIRLAWLKDGDHSFKPRKASGRTLEENLDQAGDVLTDFLLGHASRPVE